MNKLNSGHIVNNTTPPSLLPVLSKVKSCYLIWVPYHEALPKIHKYTLGQKIDNIFIEIIEAICIATFLSREEKLPWVRLAIRKTDTLRVLLMVLWEAKSIDNKKYIVVSLKTEEIGRMLGGWSGQISKQNSPTKK